MYRSLEESLQGVKVEADASDFNPRAEKVNLLNLRSLRLKNKDLFTTLFKKRQIDGLKLRIKKRDISDLNLLDANQVELDTKSKLTEEEILLLNSNVEKRMLQTGAKFSASKSQAEVGFEQGSFLFQSLPVTEATPIKNGRIVGMNNLTVKSTTNHAGKNIKF